MVQDYGATWVSKVGNQDWIDEVGLGFRVRL